MTGYLSNSWVMETSVGTAPLLVVWSSEVKTICSDSFQLAMYNSVCREVLICTGFSTEPQSLYRGCSGCSTCLLQSFLLARYYGVILHTSQAPSAQQPSHSLWWSNWTFHQHKACWFNAVSDGVPAYRGCEVLHHKIHESQNVTAKEKYNLRLTAYHNITD